MKLIQYLKESRQEMRKVVWPSKKETTNYTIAVILISLGVALFFAIADYFLSMGVGELIK